jgi:hypothetical protein
MESPEPAITKNIFFKKPGDFWQIKTQNKA